MPLVSRLFFFASSFFWIITIGNVTTAQNSGLQIAFETNLPHNDICLVSSDGTDLECLMQTDDIVESIWAWSSDGRFLAYQSIQEPVGLGEAETYIYDVERGTAGTLMKDWYIYDWSPDGEFLLAGLYDGNDLELYKVRPDESEVQVLTENQHSDFMAAWSPDGKYIAYFSGVHPAARLMVVSANGGKPMALTKDMNLNRSVKPVWSPDSKTLAFVVDGDFIGMDQTSEIYLVNADGSDLRPLTHTGGVTLDPQWSPDGRQIVFYGYAIGAFDQVPTAEGATEVFRIDTDGSHLINLTQSPGLDYHPVWSPDGEWIAFASTRECEQEKEVTCGGIYIMRPDGSDVRRVSHEPPFGQDAWDANNPVWRPTILVNPLIPSS